MRKIILNNKYTKFALLAFFGLLFCNVSIAGGSDPHFIIVSGQITNINCGTPVVGHTVYIESDTTQYGIGDYSNTVVTNNEGYYSDTISTYADKGFLIINTEDHLGISMDTTVHFRFFERGNYVVLANFTFSAPFQTGKLHARFDFIQGSGTERYNFSFFDQTINDNIKSWYWDFGDGTTSNLQNPKHEYQEFGLFKVTFTVTSMVNNVINTSVITKQLYIEDREYYHLGGHVFSEYFPIDKGYAYLYLISSPDQYLPIDTVAFDTLGFYYFYHIPNGNYVVKVEPMLESVYYGTLLPTYYGDVLFWDEAQTINLDSTCWEYNVNLANSDGMLTGEGTISGNIEYIDQPRTPLNTSAQGVYVYLFDDDDNLLTCHYSDKEGDFLFDLVEVNTYWLYPEITGIQAEKIKIELTPETPIISNIEIYIQANSINYVIPGEGSNLSDIVGTPYPNPVLGTLNVPLNSTSNNVVSYELYDMYGHKVISDIVNISSGSNSCQISTNNIKNGTYVLRMLVADESFERIFIVAR